MGKNTTQKRLRKILPKKEDEETVIRAAQNHQKQVKLSDGRIIKIRQL